MARGNGTHEPVFTVYTIIGRLLCRFYDNDRTMTERNLLKKDEKADNRHGSR